MKKLLLSAALFGLASNAMAEAPGGPGCGWGNALLEGQSGLGVHLAATITNGTSGNATFGMTSGTNGCTTDGALTYGGNSLVWFNEILDEYSTDVALGRGEALNAVAVMIGIAPQHRAHFGNLMHANFDLLFPHAHATGQQVLDAMIMVMASDTTLSRYVG